MRLRLKASAIHLSGSAVVLSVVIGGLYAGWYRWPGWYLAGALRVIGLMAIVDLALGPLTTMIIANPSKPIKSLARDIAVIVVVQLSALIYGAASLWQGRPLYYTYSVDRLQMVQASDLDRSEIALARQRNAALAPRWYSLPRWVWAPLPEDAAERQAIIVSSLSGGNDVIDMPRYFRPWEQGLSSLRQQLKPLAKLPLFTRDQKATLRQRLLRRGIAPEAADTIFFIGHGKPLLVVFDPDSVRIRAMISAD
jgi:hypothetical protein